VLWNNETSLDWQAEAACRGIDPELFFPERGGDTDTPKRVCAKCPVRGECLEHALRYRERWGVWGGASDKERRSIIRTRAQRLRREQQRGNVAS
jgi:WhiB family redox-sensing transcriptional regulator